jgi:hypothetical protein
MDAPLHAHFEEPRQPYRDRSSAHHNAVNVTEVNRFMRSRCIGFCVLDARKVALNGEPQ